MQCAKCQKFGHQGKQCTASTKCSYCSSSHSKQYCKTQYFRCVNCNGPHPSTSHDCFLWKQGKLMNELRYRGGFTAEEAIFIATDGKIQHKKHSFTFPVEYFGDLFINKINPCYLSVKVCSCCIVSFFRQPGNFLLREY